MSAEGAAAILTAAERITAAFQPAARSSFAATAGARGRQRMAGRARQPPLSQSRERPGLPALALTTDTSFLTAYSNDCGFEGVFDGRSSHGVEATS